MPVLLRKIAVPRSLLANPDRFGGCADGDLQRGDLLILGDQVIGLTRSPPSDARVVNGAGRILLPPLVEPHLHLDKAFTRPRLPDVGGDLMAAIHAQQADKANWSDGDLRARANTALAELVAAGVSHARSHVDWGHESDPAATPRAWHVLAEVAQDWADRITLDLSCLPDIDTFADPASAARIAGQVARDGGVLGAWILHHSEREKGLAQIFQQAEARGLRLDFHVDEGQDPDLDGLELIAATALQTRFQGPVLCGHAISLMNRTGTGLDRLLDDLTRAGIGLCALPTTNLYLQSRGAGTPDRRGITRLAEAAAAGITTCLGTDNVQDAFYPLGRHDPLLTLATAVPALHLDPPFGAHLPLVTTRAARALGVTEGFVDRQPAARLFLAEATSLAALVGQQSLRTPLSRVLLSNA
ncbi:MAG: amidohydrolase family protein [Tabrizicola sp.]|uniref:amidohydrolase family protein n=1 Tax=Tabrizicola sp. TaxID=2005166 RepID=UPI002ABBB90E|nr:amidohydrolase family protein [Tabrizicola sp.]MDZ4086436.1 amidohydrolase family protein [Tabrizicola sp.]